MYVPSNWKTGDIITADKLNNIETGVESSQTQINNLKVGLPENSVTSSQIAASAVTPENTNFAHGIYNILNPDSVKSGYFDSGLNIRTNTDYFCAAIPIKGEQWYNTNNGVSINLSYVRTDDGKVTTLKDLEFNANAAFKTPVGSVELYLSGKLLNKSILLNTDQKITETSQEQYPYNSVKKLTLDNLYIPSVNNYLDDTLKQLQTKEIDYHNVRNLKESLINITDKFYVLTSGNLSTTDNKVEYQGNTQSSGFYTSNFNSSSTGGIRVHLTGEFDGTSSIKAGVFYNKSDGSKRFNSEVTIDKSPFDVTFDFDQNQLAVYDNATSFTVLIQNQEAVDTKITLETIAVTEIDIENTDIYANDLTDVLININNKLNTLKPANQETGDKLIDANGDKYHLQMSNGNLITVSTIPKKVLFLGNSLLLGLYQGEHGTVNFGLCASDSKHDYYYLVSQAIISHNSTAEISKIHDAVLEMGQSTAAKYMTDNASAFTNDLDLIVIQIGDNVSTADLQSNFKNEFQKLITSIRTQCPRARVIVVGTWAGYQYGYPVVTDISARFGCEFVDISDLNVAANQSTQGAIITFDDGSTTTAKDNWITHPGDQGHKLIADRLIEKLDM